MILYLFLDFVDFLYVLFVELVLVENAHLLEYEVLHDVVVLESVCLLPARLLCILVHLKELVSVSPPQFPSLLVVLRYIFLSDVPLQAGLRLRKHYV